MSRKNHKKYKSNKNKKKLSETEGSGKRFHFHLQELSRKILWSSLMFLLAAIVTFGFFRASGMVGNALTRSLLVLFGITTYTLPFILVLIGLSFWGLGLESKNLVFISSFLFILGLSCLISVFNFNSLPKSISNYGGWVGYLVTWPFFKAFGFWLSQIISWALIIAGLVILSKLLSSLRSKISLPSKPTKELISKDISQKKNNLPSFKSVIKNITPKISKVKSVSIPINKVKPIKEKGYKFPPLDLLGKEKPYSAVEDIRRNSFIIKKTFQNFDIPVSVSEVNIGPTVTQYAITPAEGVNLSRIKNLSNNLSLALASHPLRIEAPIPGKSLVGIEVPNKNRSIVRLRNLISLPQFQNSESKLTVVLGRDVAGSPVLVNLTKMPHLLVAGSTGSGKTICLNSLILNLIYENSPAHLRLILIDPKRVEFSVYNNLPHLLTPVIFNAQKTVNALRWLTEEMERRFNLLSQAKSRNIESYNKKQLRASLETLPYIILIIDELADLMAAKGREIEAEIVRLAQMSRAVGIHLIVATQRPSVEVITGLIKANITSRIAFQVASQVDSRTILDTSGAEKLLGAGDMLFISAKYSRPKRIQGPYVSEKEVKRVVDYIEKESEISSDDNLSQELEQSLEKNKGEEFFVGGEDPLYDEAKRLVISAGKASSSLLQRRLRVGYARAARLIDMLEENGVVGPSHGAKPREVYIKGDNSNSGENDEINPLDVK